MDPNPDSIPSVGCLVYLAADQVAARTSRFFNMTPGPSKRVRVDRHLDTTSQPGLAGALLSAAIRSPDGRVGTADGEPGYMLARDKSHVLGLMVKHPYVEKEVQRELVQAGVYTQSGRAFRPDYSRIALLEPACADAVRWWKQQQADAPRLCTLLLLLCRTASIGPIGGGG